MSRILVVVAHPDDEVIGLGAFLQSMARRVCIAYVTNGSPLDPGDAWAAGCADSMEYAELRKWESASALGMAGISQDQCAYFELIDQRASFAMKAITEAVESLLCNLSPEIVITHPYEGGHPDHDAVAFGVHAAMRRAHPCPGALWEFASYHRGPNGIATGEFLPWPGVVVHSRELTLEQQIAKRRLMDVFHSQQRVLAQFDIRREPLRQAPDYDFTCAPHAGALYYEQFPWGITGSEWRALARQALQRV